MFVAVLSLVVYAAAVFAAFCRPDISLPYIGEHFHICCLNHPEIAFSFEQALFAHFYHHARRSDGALTRPSVRHHPEVSFSFSFSYVIRFSFFIFSRLSIFFFFGFFFNTAAKAQKDRW